MSAVERPNPPQRARGSGWLLPVVALLAVMWLAEIADALLPLRLDAYGIRPRTAEGLTGIPAAPLLHRGFGHLVANTVPFAVLGALVALEGRRAFWRTTATVVVVGGLGTWLLGAPRTVVIGASGVVFGYLTYVLARAWFSRRFSHIALAAVVTLLYGGLLLGVLPGTPGVSWQGHLAGAGAGVLAARLGHTRPRRTA